MKVNITVESDDAGDFAEAEKRCRATGMKVERVLKSAGAITGEASAEQAAALAKVPGITIEPSREHRVGKPGSGPV